MKYLELLRVSQWYKNVFVFLPLLFVGQVHVYSFWQLILAFFGFCSISSVTYILNDWVDRTEDAIHPTKKNRPLASGAISGSCTLTVAVLAFVFAGVATYILGAFYGGVVLIYFILTNLYSFGLKRVPVLDVLIISFNFVLRTVAGLVSIPDAKSWPYFTLLFAVIVIFLSHKRRSDNKILGGLAAKHKKVLEFYSKSICWAIRIVGFSVVIFSLYFLYIDPGFDIELLLMFFVLLSVTSFAFSENPDLTIKPFGLVKIWYWDAGVLLGVFYIVLLLIFSVMPACGGGC